MATNRPPWFTSTASKPTSRCRQVLKSPGNLSKDRGVAHSIGLVTALNPYIGYEAATKVALEAFHSGRGVYDLVLEGGLMTKDHRT
jgi:aspartate ammonia-lyase